MFFMLERARPIWAERWVIAVLDSKNTCCKHCKGKKKATIQFGVVFGGLRLIVALVRLYLGL